MKSLFLILAFFSTSVFSQIKEDGNQLLLDLKNGSNTRWGLAAGYIKGISDASFSICPPENVTNGQLYDIVQNYLEKNPATRHEYRGILVLRALSNAYPCKQENLPNLIKPL